MGTITLDWLHILALLGAVQGLILALVLAVRQRNRTANRVLAGAMVAFSIYLATSVYHAAGLEARFPHFFGAAYPMPLLYGPLVYLYAVAASDRTRRMGWRDALHFVPFALAILTALPVYLSSGFEKVAFYHALQRGDVPWFIQVFDPLKLISGVTYAAVTLLFLRRHRLHIKDNYSSLESVNLQWLVRLAAAAAAIWVLAVALEFAPGLVPPGMQQRDDVITLAIALLVYLIGYMALRQAEIHRFDTAEFPVVVETAAPAPAPMPPPEPEAAAAKAPRSGLSPREATALKNSLIAAMDKDRPWQNSELTLADLAKRLATTPHKLSEVLNSLLTQTFYDFVNGYRVREVQRLIGSPKGRNLTILSLAIDAGFASKSTFNDVFKKHTGKTPSEYRRTIAA